jgi:hypothetical protein
VFRFEPATSRSYWIGAVQLTLSPVELDGGGGHWAEIEKGIDGQYPLPWIQFTTYTTQMADQFYGLSVHGYDHDKGESLGVYFSILPASLGGKVLSLDAAGAPLSQKVSFDTEVSVVLPDHGKSQGPATVLFTP